MKAELIIKNHLASRIPSKKRGVSLIEITIAIAVLTLSISAVIMLVFANQDLKIDSLTNNEAIAKAEELIEKARADSRNDFSSVNSIAAAQDDIYTKKVDVTYPDPSDLFTKLVTSTVSWPASASRPLEIKLSTLITDPQSALGGDTCNPTISNPDAWKNPQLLGYADFSSSEGATDVDVLGKKAYVTSNPSAAGQEDFYIFNVSDPTQKPLPDFGPNSKLDTGPGLAAVHVAGKYAYAANMSRTAQLQIIDINDPANPFLAKSFKLTNVTGSGAQALGKSIFYANKKVYLGLTKTATGPEFNVIDVTDFLNNPANNPVLIGSWAAGTTVNAITVKNNIAYLATPWPSSNPPTQENLSILNVSNPGSGINRINTFSAPDPSTMSGESVYVSKDNKTLYLGRGGLNGAHNPDFFILNVDDPGATPLPVLNSKYIPTASNVAVNAITIRDHLAFLWTSDTNKEFQVWDLNDLGSSSPYGWLNTAQSGTGGLDCDGNILYTAQKSNRALQAIGPGTNIATLALSIHDATHNAIATANVGDTVHAELAASGSVGTPTGNIDFTFYTNASCGAGATSAGTVGLSSGTAHPSNNEGPLNAGSYSFNAHNGGDANYDPGDSSCVALTIPKLNPSVNTTIYNNGTGNPAVSPVSSGTVVYDKVVVSGTYGTLTGTVNFQRYAKVDCSGSHTDQNNVALVNGIAQSSNFTTVHNKDVCYKVHYNGDTNYNSADAAIEPLTVN